MTIPFKSYLNRVGLDMEEAQKVNQLTEPMQQSRSWIQLQARFRSAGMKKMAKAEAAIILVKESVGNKVLDLSDKENLLLVKAACAIYAFQYQKDLSKSLEGDFEKLNIKEASDKKNIKILEDQYLKSKDLSDSRGFLEKLLD